MSETRRRFVLNGCFTQTLLKSRAELRTSETKALLYSLFFIRISEASDLCWETETGIRLKLDSCFSICF
nr:hypothetical protein CFP56_39326 [Quercus suber]